MDSTALMFHLLSMGHQVSPISFIYGQRHSREINAAKAICQRFQIPLEVANIKTLQAILGASVLTDHSQAVPHGHYADESMKLTVVPNRNMILMAIAAGYAITRGAEAIAIAAHAGDHAIYPDCRPEFQDAMAQAFSLCDYRPIKLLRPFVKMTKADIARIGFQNRVPFELTWSCYEGGEFHCGKCGTCVERKEAFAEAGLPDLTIYAGTPQAQAAQGGGSLTLG
jgi:7-cyano-7-deazaguanine synthase